jgi:predicted anti-sigma-YlaC factor YlaD
MTSNLTCEQLVTYLSDYIDNNLDEVLTEAAQKHLETCENCRVVLDSTQQMIFLYRQQGQAQQIPAERQERLYNQLLQVFLQPTVEDE